MATISRIWLNSTNLPYSLVTAQPEVDPTPINHDVGVLKPTLLLRLSINVHRLHLVAVAIVRVASDNS